MAKSRPLFLMKVLLVLCPLFLGWLNVCCECFITSPAFSPSRGHLGSLRRRGRGEEGGSVLESHAGDTVSPIEEGEAQLKSIEEKANWLNRFFPRGKQGSPVGFGDSLALIVSNVDQIYNGMPSYDRAPVAAGTVSDPDAIFLDLFRFYNQFGSVLKLAFGPKSFMVVSDPVVAKHLLKGSSTKYDKGVLAEILEPIMGKGLIPADLETWRTRRRAIVPGFHQKWLEHMVGEFGDCTRNMVRVLRGKADGEETVDMESYFNSVSLDIIGRCVFNFDFNSVTDKSPVIEAVYGLLQEAEHRSTIIVPYWKLPFANFLIPRLRKFEAQRKIVNDVLDDLIEQAKAGRTPEDLEDLKQRDYNKVGDASLLRFLVDLRGEDASNQQLRDDLATMLIAGHETTASVLTWALFELSLPENREVLEKVRAEVDAVLGTPEELGEKGDTGRVPNLKDILQLPLVRMCIAESLRKYPEPPFLIRRALEHDRWTAADGKKYRILRAQDVFLAIYNIHTSPLFWHNPMKFDPERFFKPHKNPDIPKWAGYEPPESLFKYPNGELSGPLYPTETMADFAFLPFGGGQRKCVGDQFAYMEATICLATVLHQFDFELAKPAEEVGMKTGATIHTKTGLTMRLRPRAVTAAAASQHSAGEHSHSAEAVHRLHDALHGGSAAGALEVTPDVKAAALKEAQQAQVEKGARAAAGTAA
uniref:Cytochrome P450 n=1 Tax=Chromera velia CCMP2878 TaxID=1169474 RepID=A0A0G4GBB2_9ALVE|mmetsp:Transcript_18464/g.37359  ORF Transcript_18464/g.37359 Transcript_18464/m.37359 type:complete len:700 (+) Transcript_18464:97-2196(+)|eukprot:Cvel_21070.t1-p1 / transcript=Cvel_21070.t1 / gene=Cvel_21070 / organism=Chromera_velia_CCMP2878 / gene_product=Cytochrome P450 97B2, chloroplastic, putative / transcript_product=Cytochrome P450 97B2, chloroplastic, putative / location=Cvel_scaffold1947:23693-30280(+) / protein_length=699 / sequence_SO=supercontig / SO=protein_coding / is_pseudo=false